MARKIAITGGTGFIGRRLVQRHVSCGDEVRVLSRRLNAGEMFPGVTVHRGDLRSGDGLTVFADGADVLYHCAGELGDEAAMAETHVRGTANLLAAARGRIGRWVQLSSVGVYGTVDHGVVDEGYPRRPCGVYEETKGASDELLERAGRSGSMEHVILRPSIVFGEDMPNASLRAMASAVRCGMFFYVGRRGASANYIHVDNVVEALIKCGLSPAEGEGTFIVSDYCTLEAFVGMIACALNRPPPRLRVPRWLAFGVARSLGALPGFPLTASRVKALSSTVVYSSDKIRRDLGYKHVLTMDEAVLSTVGAWRRAGCI